LAEKTSVHKNFAANLRWLSLNRGSIADVCRALGMNRQQFNKYLSGATLPNAATLAKMSDYFQVDQRALFDRPESLRQSMKPERAEPTDEFAALPFIAARGFMDILNCSKTTQMRVGCYTIYYPWSVDPDLIIRGLIVVFRLGPYLCFKRYVKLRNVEASSRRYPRRRHEGFVAQCGSSLYFMGRNARGLRELSLISCGPTPSITAGLLHGMALNMTLLGEPQATRTTIEFIGGREVFRSALKATGLVRRDDATVPEEVREAILTPLKSTQAQMLPFGDYQNPLSAAAPT
jgi:transcriptional regulator with XRE-family HTH domain